MCLIMSLSRTGLAGKLGRKTNRAADFYLEPAGKEPGAQMGERNEGEQEGREAGKQPRWLVNMDLEVRTPLTASCKSPRDLPGVCGPSSAFAGPEVRLQVDTPQPRVTPNRASTFLAGHPHPRSREKRGERKWGGEERHSSPPLLYTSSLPLSL